MSGGMGPMPLTWQELAAWESLQGFELQPWELSFMRRLSAAYAAESVEARDADRPPPWREGERTSEARRAAIARQIRASMRGLMAAQQETQVKKRPRRKHAPP